MAKSKLEKYTRPADMGDNADSNFVNYGVKERANKKSNLIRFSLIFGYIAFATLYFLAFFSTVPYVIALLPVFLWIIVFFTWRYTQIEYEYCIISGEMKLMKVYGTKNMRVLARVRVSAMKPIAPYTDKYRAAADEIPEKRRIYGVSEMGSPDIYFGIFEEGGEKYALFFEATEKTLRVIKYYNSEVIVTKTRY